MNSEEIDFSRSEIEIFWDGILSRERATILSTFLSVTLAEQESCLKHLTAWRMKKDGTRNSVNLHRSLWMY